MENTAQITNFIENIPLTLRSAFKGNTPRIAENLGLMGKRITPDGLVKLTADGSDVKRSNLIKTTFQIWEATRRVSKQSGEILFNAFESFHELGRGTFFPAKPEKIFAEILPFWDEFRRVMIYRDYAAATILINKIIADLRLLSYQLNAEAAK
jgi:hypothetical protein